jgi:hypothetical protein
MSDRRYEHDPEGGETHGRGDRDPHDALNTPVSEIEKDAERERIGQRGPEVDVAGMGRAQGADTRGTDGDPVLSRTDDEREERNPAQSTPRGVVDAERDAVRRVEEDTGVPLEDA